MISSSIHKELDAEREYQLSKGRSYDFDDANTVSDWAAYINIHLGRAVIKGGNFTNYRKNMVKIATLACAALEAWDRNKGFPPRHFDKVFVFSPEGYPTPDHIEKR